MEENELHEILNKSMKSKKFDMMMGNIFKESIEVKGYNEKSEKEGKGIKKKKTLIQGKYIHPYNYLNAKMYIDYNKDKTYVNYFSHRYDINNKDDERKFNDKISGMIYISYRNNFPKLNIKDAHGNYLTSDSGWGCMIRSSQMLLARVCYKLFKMQYNTTKNALINHSLVNFLEYPFKFTEMPNKFSSIISKFLCAMYSAITTNTEHNNTNCNGNGTTSLNPSKEIVYDILSILPPFSIQTICSVGSLYNKTPGEYYSDIHLPHIFKSINNHFNVISNLAILPFQTIIDKSVIIKECFTEISPKDIIMKKSSSINHDYDIDTDVALGNAIRFRDKKYFFEKAGLIYVSVRIGIKRISDEYFKTIKLMFECKQFMGFVGGKDVYGYYFFGYGANHLYYLDPHVTQEAVQSLDDTSFATYQPKRIHQLKFDKLKPGLTIAFLFRNLEEYNDLFEWIDKIKNREYSFFTVMDEIDINNNDMIKAEINNEDDDF